MAFKVPKVPKLAARTTTIRTRLTENLPLIKHSELNVLQTIGGGIYGHLSLCNVKSESRHLVLKELIVNDDLSEKLFLKEAQILHSLSHNNIVEFHSVCCDKNRNLCILLEYVCFDFQPFGHDLSVSSLKDLLPHLDAFNCDGFEHLSQCIAKDIATGLGYLHGKDIVHRDMKPDNILVSNQHYDEDSLHLHWKSKPVVAKVTDFGESRTPLIQTASLLHTRTTNLFRGSPVYMAPEIFTLDGEGVDLQCLKQMDIWSYGMVLFNLLNPDLKHPYQAEINEIKQLPQEKRSPSDILQSILRKETIPRHSAKYQCKRENDWRKVLDVYDMCSRFSSRSRPNADTLIALLSDRSSNEQNNRIRNVFTDFVDIVDDVETGDGLSDAGVEDLAPDQDIQIRFAAISEADTLSHAAMEGPGKPPDSVHETSDTHQHSAPPAYSHSTGAKSPEPSIVQAGDSETDTLSRAAMEGPGKPPDSVHKTSDTHQHSAPPAYSHSTGAKTPEPSIVQAGDSETDTLSRAAMEGPGKPPDSVHKTSDTHQHSAPPAYSHSTGAKTPEPSIVQAGDSETDTLSRAAMEGPGKPPDSVHKTSDTHQHSAPPAYSHSTGAKTPEPSIVQAGDSETDTLSRAAMEGPGKPPDSVHETSDTHQHSAPPAYSHSTGAKSPEPLIVQAGDSETDTLSHAAMEGPGKPPDSVHETSDTHQHSAPPEYSHSTGAKSPEPSIVQDVEHAYGSMGGFKKDTSVYDYPDLDHSRKFQLGSLENIRERRRNEKEFRLTPALDLLNQPGRREYGRHFNLWKRGAVTRAIPDTEYERSEQQEQQELEEINVEIGVEHVPVESEVAMQTLHQVPGSYGLSVPEPTTRLQSLTSIDKSIERLRKDISIAGELADEGNAVQYIASELNLSTSTLGNAGRQLMDMSIEPADAQLEKKDTLGRERTNTLSAVSIVEERQELPSMCSLHASQMLDGQEETETTVLPTESHFTTPLQDVTPGDSAVNATDDANVSEEVTYISSEENEDEEKESPPKVDVKYEYDHIYTRRQIGLSIKDILEMCACDVTSHTNEICNDIPTPKKDSVFLIDLDAVSEKDLTCDDSGNYDKFSSPSVLVKAKISNSKVLSLETVSRTRVNIEETTNKENFYVVKRHYSEKEDRGMGRTRRIISKVYHCGKICRYASVQYIGNCQSLIKPHGNSKMRHPYMRTKPSVITEEKQLAENVSPKQVINVIESDSLGDASPSDTPRDRQQVYNIKRNLEHKNKSRNTGPKKCTDFEQLIASMDTGHFLKDIDFSCRNKGRINPNTFATTTNLVNSMKIYCASSSQHKSQLAIDMTYKVGPFYTTCLSFVHPAFVHKHDLNKHPSIFAAMVTSTGRQTEDYVYLANNLKRQGIKTLIYGTDGELALEKGLEDVYPVDERNIHLRCFNHVKDDIVAELKNLHVDKQQRTEITNSILGSEYNGVRYQGLVDVETHEFLEKYDYLSKNWPKEFKEYIESNSLRIRPLKETFVKCMGRDVRIDAGLGNPPNKYENQRAEAINSVLKEAVGAASVDQVAVHELVYDNVVLPQERECVKAIYSHGEYRIAKDFKHLEVHPSKWKTLSAEQRQRHVRKVLVPTQLESQEFISVKLSVQAEECAEYLSNVPKAVVRDIWHDAETLMSNAKFTDIDDTTTCIIHNKKAFVININKKTYACECDMFRKLKLCAHVLVCADNRSSVLDLLKNRRYCASVAVRQHLSSAAGEKRVKKPRKGKQNVVKRPIHTEVRSEPQIECVNLRQKRPYQFNEIWHNDEHFNIEHLGELNKAKQVHCISCSCLLSTVNTLPPYDIVFSHKERYCYPCTDTQGNKQMKPTFTKLATRYYCMKRKCILNRHPYFWTGLIHRPSTDLLQCHLQLIRDEFGSD